MALQASSLYPVDRFNLELIMSNDVG